MKPDISYSEMKKPHYSPKEKILIALKDKPLCVSDVQKILETTQPRVSNLLKELNIDGLVERKKIKTFVFYGIKQ